MIFSENRFPLFGITRERFADGREFVRARTDCFLRERPAREAHLARLAMGDDVNRIEGAGFHAFRDLSSKIKTGNI